MWVCENNRRWGSRSWTLSSGIVFFFSWYDSLCAAGTWTRARAKNDRFIYTSISPQIRASCTVPLNLTDMPVGHRPWPEQPATCRVRALWQDSIRNWLHIKSKRNDTKYTIWFSVNGKCILMSKFPFWFELTRGEILFQTKSKTKTFRIKSKRTLKWTQK